jgi:hypothetical protein
VAFADAEVTVTVHNSGTGGSGGGSVGGSGGGSCGIGAALAGLLALLALGLRRLRAAGPA